MNSVETVNIYQETDETIMSINNKEDRDKIYEFWYTPAYMETGFTNADVSLTSIGNTNESEALKIIKYLSQFTGAELDAKIAELINRNSDKILNLSNIQITTEYLDYVEKYLPKKTMNKLISKADQYEEVLIFENAIKAANTITAKASTKTYTKNMYKQYGNSSTFSICRFGTKVTWKVSGGIITSLSRTTPTITKPSHISVTALQRNKKYLNSTKTTGYIQFGWGYVNFYYGGKGLTGYYLIDGKVFKGGTGKHTGATITPAMWRVYKWGNI